jgi:zinc protease
LKSAVPQFYPILSSILTAPNFPAVQIEVTKRDQLDNITTLKNDNEDLGLEAFTHLLYAGTSWEHSAVGTVRSIKSFTRKDAEDFFNTYYLANNLTVGVAGDYDNDLVARLRTDLGRLPHHPLADADVPHPTITGRKVLILEKEGLEQGQINIGHPLNVNRQNSDFPALYIANQHFGSHRTFTGILMNEIRSDRGLTYGAYSYIEYFPYPYHSGAGMLPMPNIARSQQDWRMWTFTLSKNMDFTVRLMLLKFQELLKNGISEERFKKIQSYAQDKFVFLVETTERQIAMKLDDKVYGTEDFARTFQQRLADTTYEQFNAALKKHLSLDNLAVVVTVPHAQAFKAELLSPSATIEYQGNIDSKPLAKEDNAAKALDLKLQETDIKVITADQLFE